MNLFELWLLPVRIMLNAVGSVTPSPTQLGLTRKKATEHKALHPEQYDKDGNWIGDLT
jgi:hypothetical protein